MLILRNHQYKITLIAVLILGFFLRIFRIGSSGMWYDELYTARVGTGSLDSVIPEALASRHPPLYYLALHVWSYLGSSDAWLRLLPVVAGVISLVFIYEIGKRLISRRVGLWSALLAAISPFLIWYSRDATDYSWAVFTTLASAFCLIKATETNKWIDWGLYVAASAAALFTHYYAILFIFAEIAMFLLLIKPGGRWRPWLISQVMIGVLILPWLLMLNQAKAYAQGNLPGLKLPPIISLVESIGTAPITFVKGYAGMVGRGETALFLSNTQKVLLVLALFLCAITLAAIRSSIEKSINRNYYALIAFAALAVSLPVFFQLSQGELVAGRYFAIAAPFFYISLAALVNLLPKKISFVVLCAIILAMLQFFNVQRSSYAQEDWRSLIATIDANGEAGDEILCFPYPHCQAARDYYDEYSKAHGMPVKGGAINGDQPQNVFLFPPEYLWVGYRGNPPENFQMIKDQNELELRLNELTKNSKRIWLVSGTGNLGNYPKAKIIEEELSLGWVLDNEWNFMPLNLKLYHKKESN